MANRPATLRVDVVADTRDASQKLSQFSGKVAGFTAGITAAVGSFALDKVADAVTSLGGAIVDGIGDAASLSASLETLKKNYAAGSEAVAAWSKDAATNLGLSRLEAVKAVNGFAVYTRALGIADDEAVAFSTGLTSLAADLAAFNDLTTAEAIAAIGSAFRGERDPLERFGILLNDAQVKAAYFRRTGEEVTGTLTTQQNILGTLTALYEQAGPAVGAFASESDQLGNRTQVLSARLDDLKTALGEKLLPYVIEVAEWASDELLPALEDLGRWVGQNLVPAFVSFANYVRDSVIPALQDLWAWIEEYIGPVFEKLANWISTELMPRLEDFWGMVQRDLVPVLQNLWDKVTELWGSLQKLWDELEPVREALGKVAGPLAGGLLLYVFISLLQAATVLTVAIQVLTTYFDFVGGVIGFVIDKAQTLWGWLNDLKDLIWDIWENTPLAKILDFGGNLLGAAWDWISGGGGGGETAAATPTGFVQNNTIQVPPGALGQDSGAIIAQALEDAFARGAISNPFGG